MKKLHQKAMLLITTFTDCYIWWNVARGPGFGPPRPMKLIIKTTLPRHMRTKLTQLRANKSQLLQI